MRALALVAVVALAGACAYRGEMLAALCAGGWALALQDRWREGSR